MRCRGHLSPSDMRAALLFLVIVVAGVCAGPWLLPGQLSLGQTIPRPTVAKTAVPTKPPTLPPTWTPRPPTPVPTATALPTVPPSVAEPTPAPVVTLETGSPAPTSPSTPSLTSVRATPSPSSTAEPPRLAFQVASQPAWTGPGDEIRFQVLAANAGGGPRLDLEISAAFPKELSVRSVDCRGCPVQLQGGRLAIGIRDLAPGLPVSLLVVAQVSDDAWPGQDLTITWQAATAGLPVQQAATRITLPWAELPATGRGSKGAAAEERSW